MVFGSLAIRWRVMTTMNTRINNAQKDFEEECTRIDTEATRKKADYADKMVLKVLNG